MDDSLVSSAHTLGYWDNYFLQDDNAPSDQRVFDTHEDPPEMVFKSGLLMQISIVFMCFTGNGYDISVYNYIFNY